MRAFSCLLISCVMSLSGVCLAQNYTVTNLNDSGPGSLRQAVQDAMFNQQVGNTIDFSVTGTIMLTTGSIDITRALTINGPAGGIIIDSTNNVEVPVCLASNAGAFYIVTEGQPEVIFNDLTIQNGNATQTGGGGAIYASFSTVTANRCTFINNAGARGGAIYANTTALTLVNCTFDGNTASLSGEAVYIEAFFQGLVSLTVINCTSTDTLVANGQEGVVIPFTLRNSIVTASTTGVTVMGTNLIGNVPDPLLGALANNGGPTRTFALQPGSPAINAGTSGAGIPAIDQRGTTRDSQVDIGSFEFVPQPPVITSVTIPQTVVACEPVTVVVDAMDPQGATMAITYTWGDGSSDTTGTHTYCTPGTYMITVTVTSTSGTTSVPLELTVTQQQQVTPPSLKFRVLKGLVNAEGIKINGILSIPAGFQAAGKVVVVKVGSVERSFTLDASGAATSGSDTFALRLLRKTGKAYEGRFKTELVGNFADALKSGVPLNGAGQPEQIVVQITFLDKVLTNRSLLKYAKSGSGAATFRGGGME